MLTTTSDPIALDQEHVLQVYKRAPVVFESGKGCALFTRAGERYLDLISGVGVASLGHAHPALARAIADQASALLHTSNLFHHPLQAELATLQQRHPELSIDLILNDRFVDPVIEGVDVSIRVGRLGEGGFVARPLGRVRRALLASPAYLARAGVPASPAALGAHPFIHIDGLARDGKLHLDGPDGAPVTAPVRSAWRCNHWRPLLAALLAGNGIGVLHRPVCRNEWATGQLVPVLPDHRLPDLPVHAIYPASRRVPAKTGAVVAWLQTQLPALLDQDEDDDDTARETA